MIEDIIIRSVISGAIYALLSLGFTLVYGVAGVMNLAHGAFFMVGAHLFAAFAVGFFQLGLIPALILAAISVGIVSSILYRLTIHPIIEDQAAVLVVTISLAIILQKLIELGFELQTHVPPFWKGAVFIWGVWVDSSEMLAFIVSLALFASLGIIIKKSKIGKAMRAASQDREVAMLMGVNTERLYMLTMALSGSLAAVAGVFVAAHRGTATPFMWLPPLAMSFAIVILGGLGSMKGTFVGSFIIAFAAKTFEIVGAYTGVSGRIWVAVPFAIMVLVLLIRPKGLFGKRIEMEE